MSTAAQRLALDGARTIGEELCASALWDASGTRCNWLGRIDIVDEPSADLFSSRTAALSPESTAGAPGSRCSFPSSRASRATSASRGRRWARSGGRSRAGGPISERSGRHRSTPACWGWRTSQTRCASLDCGAAIRDDVDWLAGAITASAETPPQLDVVSGAAGSVPVLFALAHGPMRAFEDAALACVEAYHRSALREGDACSWDAQRLHGSAMTSAPMTGLSHGVSGPAGALFEAYAWTGERRHEELALAALRYEDRYFSRSAGNWADTRQPIEYDAVGEPHGRFVATWCYGAPGMGLVRARAAALARDESWLAESASVALETTRASLRDALAATQHDATLCHGSSGLADALLTMGRALDAPDAVRDAAEAAEQLIGRYAANGRWPSGLLAGGPNPSLMIGSAGIGLFFLRLADPRVRGVLQVASGKPIDGTRDRRAAAAV